MKVALLSDTHGYLPPITNVDAVLHAGDIGVDRDPINWFREKFYPWARWTAVPIYATFGNHDRIGERLALPPGQPENLHFVVDELRVIHDVPVWFSPWSLRYGDWAFMANDVTLAKKYALIPAETQVIVTHGPPFDVGDRTIDDRRTGSEALLARMRELPALRLVVTGHIHEAHGAHQADTVTVLNVSHVDEWYNPVHDPTIIDWPPEKQKA